MLQYLRQNIFFDLFSWHFYEIPKSILDGWENFLRFNLEFWSIPLLLKTFFSHWHKYRFSYGKGFNLNRYFEVFTFNLMSRIIGAILRFFFIIIGLSIEILIFFLGLIAFLVWIFLPFILALGIITGFVLLLFE